ncbi:MAG: hypothetical protein LBL65_06045 [Campylobacteraceae bacterium]|jgi:hypothetical protein|nr:hypothetical protein [Campylobacteraceae bacterium]
MHFSYRAPFWKIFLSSTIKLFFNKINAGRKNKMNNIMQALENSLFSDNADETNDVMKKQADIFVEYNFNKYLRLSLSLSQI